VLLVLRQTLCAHCHAYLDPQYTSSSSHGPAYELCVEIHAADGFDQSVYRRHLAFHTVQRCSMACLRNPDCCFLRPAWPRPYAVEQAGKTNLSVRRLALLHCEVVFVVRAIRIYENATVVTDAEQR